jgi:hypothetical protein
MLINKFSISLLNGVFSKFKIDPKIIINFTKTILQITFKRDNIKELTIEMGVLVQLIDSLSLVIKDENSDQDVIISLLKSIANLTSVK